MNASTNVALNKPATANHTYPLYELYGLHRTVDGDPVTLWSASYCNSDENSYWLLVDLEDA